MQLSEEEKNALVLHHYSELKRLRASMLRSDWHAAFEAALSLTTQKYGNAVRVLVEEELGIDPPRADFIVLIEEPGFRMQEEIY